VSHLIEFFYSDHCLSCPEARTLLRRFASDRPDITVVERNINDDGDYERAQKQMVEKMTRMVEVKRGQRIYVQGDPSDQMARV